MSTTFKQGKLTVQIFDQEIIDLNIEIGEHPALMDKLQDQPANEFEIRLAVIATYCDVVLNAVYTPEDIRRLCTLLTDKLRAKRGGLIVVDEFSLTQLKQIN
jgi:hypothetical protein